MSEKILVIEDHHETRDVITIWLERLGYDVIVANDGQEGLDKGCAEGPDLIITDIRMPQVDGFQMIQRLRQTPKCWNIPILVVTGYYVECATDAIVAGADRALAKPVEPESLHALVQDLLRTKRSGAAKQAR